MRISSFVAVSMATLLLMPNSVLAKSHEGKSLPAQANVRAQINSDLKHSEEKLVKRWLQQTLRGTLTAINTTNLTLKVGDVNFTIDASSATFTRRFGGAMTAADLQVNDKLIVQGTWQDGGVLKATKIQDLSLQARNGNFSGTVTSVDATAKSFVLTTNKRGTQTIFWDANTRITKNGATATSTDIMVGNAVRVDGAWNRTNENVTATKIAVTTPQVQIHFTGRVTATSTNAITVLSSDAKTYQVSLDKASLVYSTYLRMKTKEIAVGDSVDVWARGEAGALTVNAYFVRNLSQMNAKTHVITVSDMNTARVLDVGDRLVLKLNSGYVWSAATSSNPIVLAPVSGTAMTFEAKSVGQSQITVNGDPTCRAATPACAQPSFLFKLDVRVAASAS